MCINTLDLAEMPKQVRSKAKTFLQTFPQRKAFNVILCTSLSAKMSPHSDETAALTLIL